MYYCHNCGLGGHIYKRCKKPIMSYGIILFYKYRKNELLNMDGFQNRLSQLAKTEVDAKEILEGYEAKDGIKYLMILDKYTPDYVQIILGNYNLNNVDYLEILVSRLTRMEIDLINYYSIEYLFTKYWMHSNKNPLKIYRKQYLTAKYQFEKLKEGYTSFDNRYVKFSELVEKCAYNGIGWNSANWGFSKGRRKKTYYESDIECAIREFKEETGIDRSQYYVYPGRQFIEQHRGSNGVMYRHVYYLAHAKCYLPIYINPYNRLQMCEIQKIGWYSREQAVKMIRPYHTEKIELLNNVENIVKEGES
jgi:hypothetical protein